MPLVLEITHATAGSQRIELLEVGTAVSLKIDGEILRYYPGGPPRPEVLHFGTGPERTWFTAVGELTLQHKELRPQLPEHNGKKKEKGEFQSGDVFRWRDHTVTVSETREPSQPEWAMVEAARTSDSALLVYADWLESSGKPECAEWARLSLQDTPAAKARMAELATRVGSDFRALVARGPIERCWKNCDQRWENLAVVMEPWSRSCRTCSTSVRWCPDSETARLMRRSGPVTLDPVTPRKPGDLVPPPRPVG